MVQSLTFPRRHGNRLDAADRKWHLTSPTPYDPPLTYGGFQQGRQVGNQIASILEQAKLEHDAKSEGKPNAKRRRFKIIIHTSPFLRCVQTSVGISSGLAQIASDSIYKPSDIIVPPHAPQGQTNRHKTAILRIDAFLGEWLSPEYFEMITPPPGPALMLGGAKAELLRREDYSGYSTEPPPPTPTTSTNKLWQASPTVRPADLPQSPASDVESPLNLNSLAVSLPGRQDQKKGYAPPLPAYSVSSAGKIPEGIVAHARDACVTVDYQWDSMREPLDFGDSGQLGEEWTSMHKRFRKGLRRLVNWYAAEDDAAEMVTHINTQGDDHSLDATADDDVQEVVILVSHGAGCNALMGAITHQPVLMDVGIASLTMAVRRPNIDYKQLLAVHQQSSSDGKPLVAVDDMYEIRMSASTEHLQSTSSTPVSSRSSSAANAWNPHARGRTATFSTGGPVMSPFTYTDPFSSGGSRSTSANASMGTLMRRESSHRTTRVSSLGTSSMVNGSSNVDSNGASNGSNGKSDVSASSNGNSNGNGARSSSPSTTTSFGLWAPAPSTLRLMDDGSDDSESFDSALPSFDGFQPAKPTVKEKTKPRLTKLPAFGSAAGQQPLDSVTMLGGRERASPGSPMFAAPIKLQTNLANDSVPLAEEVSVTPLGGGLGGLWGQPPAPGEAERFRDMSHTKRRWTVNERAK